MALSDDRRASLADPVVGRLSRNEVAKMFGDERREHEVQITSAPASRIEVDRSPLQSN